MDNRHTNTDSGSTWISMRRSSQSRSRDTSQSATAGPEAEGQSEPPSATALASGAPAAAPRTSPAFAGAYSRDRPSTPHRVIVYRTNYSGRRGNGESDDNTDGDNSDSNSEDGDDNGDNSSHAADMSVYANDYEESASGSDSSSDADPNSDDDGDGDGDEDEDEDEDYISDYGLIDESAADYDLYNQAMVVNVVNIGDEEEDTSDNSHGHGASSSDDEHQSSDPARSPGSRSGRSALMSISGSFENLPSLTDASAPSNKSSARRARGSSSSGRSKNSFYLPEYLEKSVYGAINRSLRERRARVKSTDKMPLGSLPDTPASNADCESAIAQLAPDMFFKTLVQDTWPHYCTPVSSMSTFNGLRLGYGLDLRGEAHNASSELRQRGVSSALSSTGLRRPMQARDGAASEDGGVRSSQQAFPSALAVTQRANGESLDRDARLHRLPSEWSPVRNSQNITAASNRLDIRYTGPGRVDHDAAMILANNSIPMHVGVYYYEVFIKSRGQSGYIGIGLTRSNMLLTRLPGWDAGSWGFHGDDGNCFGGDGRGRPYGPGFKSGDTVGCGVNFANRRIFFTRNGVFLGYAFDNIDTSKPLYPCVGMRTQGEHVVANFGRSGFVFDICHYVNSVHEEALANVRSTSLASVLPKNMLENSQGQDKEEEQEQNGAPRPASIVALRSEALKGVARGSDSEIDQSDATLCIVLEHLLHNECYATAQALIENAVGNRSTADGASGASDAPSTKIEAVLQMLQQQDRQRVTRKRICSHIRRGEIDAALGLLQDAYPAVLESEPIVFQLRCRQFVELVRLANGDSIASSIPNDDQQLPRPAGASSWRGQTGDMMDVDDSHSPAMLSLTAITNGPSLPRHVRFGQIGNVQSMDQAQLVRVLLEYGRQLQADYGTSSSAIVREGLVHTFSLLAYANPAQSPVSGLLDPAAREPLASLVEMAIVASENAPRMSALECICRQTGTILRELSGHRNGAASLMSLKHDFIGGSGSIE